MNHAQQTVPLLLVADINRSRDFYCDGLGFEITKKWEPEGHLTWCWLQHGGAGLMLQRAGADHASGGTRGKGVTFYFICEDAEAIYLEISARGMKASKPTVAFYGMKQTFISDPDGYELCFENQTGEA